MDAYGHVNNVDMMRLLEIARIEAFWASETSTHHTGILDASPGSATATFVARQEIEYLKPLTYKRAPIIVELWIGHIGGASLDVCYIIRDDTHDGSTPTIYAQAITTIVLVETATNTPRRISAQERETWLPYVDFPVKLRHRRRSN